MILKLYHYLLTCVTNRGSVALVVRSPRKWYGANATLHSHLTLKIRKINEILRNCSLQSLLVIYCSFVPDESFKDVLASEGQNYLPFTIFLKSESTNTTKGIVTTYLVRNKHVGAWITNLNLKLKITFKTSLAKVFRLLGWIDLYFIFR